VSALRADMAPPSAGRALIPNLQFARCVAAMMVLVHHLELELKTPRLHAPVKDVIGVEWSIGVDLFFMVSGFIMLLLTRDHFGEKGFPAAFLRRRAVRVIPMYWLFTALMIASILLSSGAVNHADLSPGRVIGSFLFIPWPRAGGDVYPILGLGWTLNYEVEFYLAFALALLLPLKWGAPALAVGFALAAACGLAVPHEWFALKFWTDPIILEFLLGMAIARLYLQGVRLPAVGCAAAIVLGLGLSALTTRLGLVDAAPRIAWGGGPAACIFAGLCLAKPPTDLGPFLKGAILAGDASYALYLSHMFVIRLLTTAWARLGMIDPLLYLVSGLVLATAAAIGIHIVLERPLLAGLSRLLPERRNRGSAQDSTHTPAC
jgi:exopolysaccharide production protein ExoZ